MKPRALPEWFVYVPLLHIVSLWYYHRQLRFPRDLLPVLVFIGTAVVLSMLTPRIPDVPGSLANACALYLLILLPALTARQLARKSF